MKKTNTQFVTTVFNANTASSQKQAS